jgi:two-component system, sensor histidine kinase
MIYPNPDFFPDAQPFHLAFDLSGTVRQFGPALAELAPDLRVGRPLRGVLGLVFRGGAGIADLPARAPVDASLRVERSGCDLTGRIVPGSEPGTFVFLGALTLSGLEVLRRSGGSLSLLAPHFPYLEMLSLIESRTAALADARSLADGLDARRRELEAANVEMARTLASLRNAREALKTERAASIEAQAALEISSAALREANQKLADSDRKKGEFLAFLSHELRTPLAGMLNVCELIVDGVAGPVTETQLKYLRKAHERGIYIQSLVNDLLDWARLEHGTLKLEAGRPSVSEVVRPAVEMISEAAATKRQTISVDIPENECFAGDRRRLTQVFLNLLHNAVKFTPEGGELGVTVRAVDGKLQCRVWDHGFGIPPEHLPNLFKAFNRLENPAAKNPNGVGLGLVLVQRILELHGVEISVKSTPGFGSSFVFVAPAAAVAAAPVAIQAKASTRAPAPAAPAEGSPKTPSVPRILVAEDDQALGEVVAGNFRSAGWSVDVVPNGRIAVERLLASPPDLVILDMQMPELDGCGAARAMRAAGYAGPILAATAMAAPEDKKRCLEAGMDDYISKPFRLSLLTERVVKLLVRADVAGSKQVDGLELQGAHAI